MEKLYSSIIQYFPIIDLLSCNSSVDEIFPLVSLNFAGGASMVLRPQDYLLEQNSIVSFL